MLTILFSAPPARWPQYQAPLRAALAEAGIAARIVTDPDAPETVDYIVYAPNDALSDFTPFTRCRAVLSLWAGVERIVTNPTLTQPLCRMVEAGLEQGMREWVAGHVLRHHLGLDAHVVNPAHRWEQVAPPLAQDRRVAILGLGALGRAAAGALVGLGFDVLGWSRTPREIPGVACHHGEDGLRAVLSRAEIAVLLLPLTAATDSLMTAERLGWMPPGAVLINPGRGALIDEAALIAALDAGDLAHATLDVFRTEPLPPEHPFWAHPGVTVTPHVAAETRPASAARVIAENIRRAEHGAPLLHLVDRARGY